MQYFHRLTAKVRSVVLHWLPQTVHLNEPDVGNMQFKVHSPVEKNRITRYGEEYDSWKYFITSLQPTDIVYDIGASIGLFTIASALHTPQGKIFAFEPDPDTRQRLEANAQLNSLTNIEFIPWAASNQEGTVILYSDGAAGFAPSLAIQHKPKAPNGRVSVPTCSVDIAISRNQMPVPDVMKIDIEGAEGLCLQGCAQLFDGAFGKLPRVIFIELHPFVLNSFGFSVEEIKQLFINANYELRWSQKRAEQEHLFYELPR